MDEDKAEQKARFEALLDVANKAEMLEFHADACGRPDLELRARQARIRAVEQALDILDAKGAE